MSQLDSTDPAIFPPDPRRHWFIAWFGGIWCRLFHRKVMLPIHGYYQCRRCFRRIPISFELGGADESAAVRKRR